MKRGSGADAALFSCLLRLGAAQYLVCSLLGLRFHRHCLGRVGGANKPPKADRPAHCWRSTMHRVLFPALQPILWSRRDELNDVGREYRHTGHLHAGGATGSARTFHSSQTPGGASRASVCVLWLLYGAAFSLTEPAPLGCNSTLYYSVYIMTPSFILRRLFLNFDAWSFNH